MKASQPPNADTDKARRKLLRIVAWTPPAIVAAVSVGTRHAIAWSCTPGLPCGPDCPGCCMPEEACNPDKPCMPVLGCMPG